MASAWPVPSVLVTPSGEINNSHLSLLSQEIPESKSVRSKSVDHLRPKGPNNTFKTGQRVPWSGTYVDQYDVPSRHKAGKIFPPCLGRRGECAYRKLVKAATTA
jgi:hypothetical protein